jgi:SAM-dependent methyltransferase
MLKNLTLMVGALMMTISAFASKENIISHNEHNQKIDLGLYESNIKAQNNLTFSFDDTIKMLHQLAEFDLGKFLLSNKGLDGYWTAYVILHGPKQKKLSDLENWMLNDAPAIKATRERFHIFQTQIKKHLNDNMVVASIPCGLMDDYLTLNLSKYNNIKIIGIDLDPSSLEAASKNAQKFSNPNVELYKKDAWKLGDDSKYDVITSNGLNIYEPNNDKVVALYKNFYDALKPNGVLITSFLTPPPTVSKKSSWKNFNIQDALKQKVIFGDIIQAGWQSFRTEAQTRDQLIAAGFTNIEFEYDQQGMFPTVIAKKIKPIKRRL